MRVGPTRFSWPVCALISTILILGFVPGVVAETIHFNEVTVNLGPEQIHADLNDHRFEGTDAQELRYWIDNQYGDGDGEVTQEEVDDFTSQRMDELNDQLRLGGAFFFEPFKINGRQALSQEVTQIRLSDPVLGTVDSDETVIQDVEARLTFPSTERSRVDVSFEEDFRVPFSQVEMEWGNATFTAVEPWAIDPGTISPDGAEDRFFDDGAFHVPYEDSGDFSSRDAPLAFQIANTTLEELEDGSKDSPGPAGVLLLVPLAGLCVAVAASRRAS